jgi:hypothetical protein
MPTSGMASVDEIPRDGSYGFGVVGIGQHGARVFTLRNPGAGLLSITKIVVPAGDGQITAALDDLAVTALAPGAWTTFTVTYAPSAASDRSDTVTLVTSDPNGDYSFSVTGTGVRAFYGLTLLPSAYRALGAARERAVGPS